MKTIVTVILFFLTVSLGIGAPFRDSATGLVFPDVIAEWTKVQETKYPEKDLGVAIGYNRGDSDKLTIYIYSRGYFSIESGGLDLRLGRELADVASGIETAWGRKGAQVFALTKIAELKEGSCSHIIALGSAHRIIYDSQSHTSLSAVAGYKNRIFKVRYTYKGIDLEQGVESVAELMRILIRENVRDLDPFFDCIVADGSGKQEK